MKIDLRELFLVTVIVALALGWWLENRSSREAARNQRIANLKITMRLELAEAQLRLLRPFGE